jgi:hypothetical protein
MELYHRHVTLGCSVGLWPGEDCFRAYSPCCEESHLVHGVHTKQTDLIDEPTHVNKLIEVRTAKVLQFWYTGRLDPMKAPPN